MDRFYKTAQFFKLDTIIRVTADNPLIDYRIIEKLFYKIVRNNILKYDYASTRVYKRTWPFGLDSEVFSFKALKKKIWSKELSKSDLEHVTPYFYRNPEEFKVFEMVNNSDLSNIKLSVDTLEDFNFIEKIYKQIYDQNPKFCIDDILNYLKLQVRNKSIEELANRIVSLDRTLVSDGYDQALKIISEYIPIKTHKIPSGKEIWTWVVPKKWTVKESYFSDGSNRYADYQKNPLHLISYSKPFKGKVSREELLKHIRTIKKYPDEIPFHYSYYDDEWGFCMAENELKKLKSDFYDVNIDVELTDGHLKIGEYFKKGKVKIVLYLWHIFAIQDNLMMACREFLPLLVLQSVLKRFLHIILIVY